MRYISPTIVLLFLTSCSTKEPPLTGARESVIISNLALDISPGKRGMRPKSGIQDFSMKPKELWRYKFYDKSINGNAITASPLVYNGCVFVVDAGGIVHCLDKKNGQLKWKLSTTVIGETGQSGAAIAVHKNELIVSNSFCDCFFINIETGKIVSRIKLPAPCKGDGLLVENNVAYFSCLSNTIHAVDINSRNVLWSYNGIGRDDGYIGMAKPIVFKGSIIVALTTGELICLDKRTGKLIWKTVLSNYSVTDSSSAMQHLRTNLTIDRDVIYVSSPAGMTFAIAAGNGDKLWKQHIGGMLQPNIADDSIFVTNEHLEIARLNKLNGQVETIYKINTLPKNTGLFDKLMCKTSTNATNCIAQFLTKEALLHITNAGEFIYTSYENEEKLNTFKGIQNISVAPTLYNGEIFVISDDGYVTAYGNCH